MSNIIATLPKVDLCRDFTGSLSPAMLRDTLGKKSAKFSGWKAFDSVETYRSSLQSLRRALNKASDWEQAAERIVANLVERSIVHAEFHLDPLHSKVSIGERLERIEEGYEAYVEDNEEALLSFGYILELDRDGDVAAQGDALEEACASSTRVLAVAVVGAEKSLTDKQKALLERARERGLRLVMSAGLEPRSKAIGDAVELSVDRVLHGMGLLKKESALTQIRARRTAIVSTPTIEVRTGRAKSYARHPLRKMQDAGLFCMFASGCPALIGGSLTSEFEQLSLHLNWRLDALRNSTLRAVEAGFIEPKLRFVVARAVENWRHRPRLTAGGDEEGFGL